MNEQASIERGARALDGMMANRSAKVMDNTLPPPSNVAEGPSSSILRPLRVIGLHEFIALKITPRSAVLGPWLLLYPCAAGNEKPLGF